jgi:hypothetical protein
MAYAGTFDHAELAAPAAAPPIRARDHLITVLTATWLLVGLIVDGWAHDNNPALETFWTPWHAIFYSGFLLTASWLVWLALRNVRAGYTGPDAIPTGYALAYVGLGVFAAGGIGDAVWHTIFGIEVDLPALLSPSHLALFTGMALILSAPLCAAWTSPAPRQIGWRSFAIPLTSLVLVTALAHFASQYASSFLQPAAVDAPTELALALRRQGIGDAAAAALIGLTDPAVVAAFGEYGQIRGVLTLLLTALLLVFPVLVVLRRWQPPFGAVTALFAAVALLQSSQHNVELWPYVAAATAAGLLGDVAIHRLRPSPERAAAFRAVAALLPVCLLGAYFVAAALAYGIEWEPELAPGVVLLGGVGGLALGLLVTPTCPGRER